MERRLAMSVHDQMVDKKNIPKVSIGMPVYNGAHSIREALDSLLAQTFNNFELIISDNASTDGTEAICLGYAAKDTRVRYVRQSENRGAARNFTLVLGEARGQYFMWAAADDLRDAKFLELAVSVLESQPSVGAVYSWAVIKNLLTGEEVETKTGFITINSKFLRVLFRLLDPTPSLVYSLMRKELIDSVAIENFDYWDCYLGLIFECRTQLAVLPFALYTIGVEGERIPYSVTGRFVDPTTYFKRCDSLFRRELKKNYQFGILYLFNRFLFKISAFKSNARIKSAGKA